MEMVWSPLGSPGDFPQVTGLVVGAQLGSDREEVELSSQSESE